MAKKNSKQHPYSAEEELKYRELLKYLKEDSYEPIENMEENDNQSLGILDKLNSMQEQLESLKKENNEHVNNLINENNNYLPSGGFIIRKRGDDYEMFPENQIMWRAMEDFKLMISLIGTVILIILIIVFFYNLGKYFDFIFGSTTCGILFSIVGVWHTYSFNSYKFIQKHIKSGIIIGFIIGILLYDILNFIISFDTTTH